MIQPWETDPAAVAYEFITAGGMNPPDTVDLLLESGTDEENAAAFTSEAFAHWEMYVSRDDFQAACLTFIRNRPDRENPDA